jgi:hypothetical protein
MNAAFLVFANLWLLMRMLCLFRDEATGSRSWLAKTLVELLALGAFYALTGAWLVAAAAIVVLNLAANRIERSAGKKDLPRLLLGIVGLGVWSVLFSPQSGLGFRPELVGRLAALQPWTAWGALAQDVGGVRTQLVVFGLLLTANETNLLIRAIFDGLNLKPHTSGENGGQLDEREFNRGRVIGLLERVLLYGFVLQAQYGAIGFVLAAKAFTRSKALENNRAFGEYVLIGTLLSASLALLIGGVIKWLLARV